MLSLGATSHTLLLRRLPFLLCPRALSSACTSLSNLTKAVGDSSGYSRGIPSNPENAVGDSAGCSRRIPSNLTKALGVSVGPSSGTPVMDARSLERLISAISTFVPELTTSKHKGQAGRIAVVGGCREYTGAPYFAAIAALRMGADLSHVICSKDAAPVIKSYSPELIVHPLLKESYELLGIGEAERAVVVASVVEEVSYWVSRMDAVVIGPGLGRDPLMMDCIAGIMKKARESNIPLVIDADGLFLVNSRLDLVQGYPLAILTPNKVELMRLHQSLKGNGSGTAQGTASKGESLEALQELAQRLGGVTLVQKGQTDNITDGVGSVQVSVYGSPRRCGGQGDILSGCMAVSLAWAHRWHTESEKEGEGKKEAATGGQMGLPHSPVVMAACAASIVVRHTAAFTYCEKRRSMVTGDIINGLGDSFESFFPTGDWEPEPRL